MKTSYSSNSIFKGISKAFIDEAAFRNRFYTYNPESLEAWQNRIEDVSARSYQREALVNALLTINKKLGASKASLENIEKLRNENTYCIVTGQQTGVLGGPLYTLYKAATTIKKAKELSKRDDVNVVPVFWMASEDHDFEEARETSIIDEGKLRKLKVDKKPGSGNNNPFKTPHNYSYIKEPVGWVDINTSVKSLMIEAKHAWSDSAFKAWCIEVFEASIYEDETLSQWFGRLYLKIFQDQGIIVIDPLSPEIRHLGKGFFTQAVEKSQDVVASVVKAGQDLKALGYTPLINPRPGATGLYYLERGERMPLIHEEGMFTVREGDEREIFSLCELQESMKSRPQDFSTNVILRPIIQDVYLPTLAYVAGPGEVAYYAQLKEAYRCFDMNMPIILPRENYTVCPENISQSLRELDLDVETILANDQLETERDLLRQHDQIDVDTLFEDFQNSFNREYDNLIEKLATIDEDINDISRKNKLLIANQFEYLKQKSHRFHRKNHKDELKVIKRVYDILRPYAGPQERSLSPLNVLSLTGPDFINYIVNELEYDRQHRIITLK